MYYWVHKPKPIYIPWNMLVGAGFFKRGNTFWIVVLGNPSSKLCLANNFRGSPCVINFLVKFVSWIFLGQQFKMFYTFTLKKSSSHQNINGLKKTVRVDGFNKTILCNPLIIMQQFLRYSFLNCCNLLRWPCYLKIKS